MVKLQKFMIFWKSHGFSIVYGFTAFLYISTNLYWLITHPASTDHVYYWDFMQHFPQLYNRDTWGFYQVLYLPHFYLCYFLFYQTSVEWAYLFLSILNGISLFLIWIVLRRDMDLILRWSFLFVFFPSAVSLGLWGNFELSLCALLFLLYSLLKTTSRISVWWALPIALAGFKIITFIWIALFRFHLSRRKFWIFIGVIFCWLVFLDIPFLIINWGVWDWILLHDLFVYRSSHLQTPLLLFTRISFTWPFIWLLVTCGQRLLKKLKTSKSSEL